MTIGNYIKEKFKLWAVDYSADAIDLELALLGLSSEDEATPETNLDRFFYNVIPDILMMPKSVSEGGYSISYDAGALKAYYSLMAKKLGLSDNLSSDKIIDITNRW